MAAILQVNELCKRFGAVTAADNITLNIEQDSIVGLIGSNGAGKTTFINMVTGYLKPTSGRIRFQGKDITPLSPREITRTGICRSFQIPQLFNSLSVYENLLVGLRINTRMPLKSFRPGVEQPEFHKEDADEILERFNLTSYRHKLAGVLPEGIRKLLDIAMAMSLQPQILLLDEPTSGVSADEKFGLMDMVMKAVLAQGVTILFVEHDMDIVSRYTHRVLAFYEGRVIADGEPAAVLAAENVRKYVIGGDLQLHSADQSSEAAT